eukprot:CAMPEP_0176353472 /NCGR_PEP_ID=MMETSP0126-20121128/11806_1 /TAXON_ID=141414 ORGANISM="Strombidinopsis acuminatum, Strain SPMC142" /NCGR_SAMPLE_ID=MMETSP0126 /ASSEMBLY_ACC=CAM_ASM_000229 /LENGTH=35 /DNA_ID= /DNA_START= /DNA_END= /DNA_ORIENTATION=
MTTWTVEDEENKDKSETKTVAIIANANQLEMTDVK